MRQSFETLVGDWQARNHWDLMLPVREEPYLPERGGSIWKQETEIDPWERLAWAVIGKACADYVEAVLKCDVREMNEIRQWFGRNEYSWTAFEDLFRRISECRCQADAERLRRRIRAI